MTTHPDRDGSELNRFTSAQEATGATPAPQDTSDVLAWQRAHPEETGIRLTDFEARLLRGHTGGNGEDCPICRYENLPYPFLCRGTTAPAGLPLHESADRDADNVPSDRVREYAEAMHASDCGCDDVHPWHVTLARACVAVEERHAAELRDRLARVEALADRYWWASAVPTSLLRTALRGPEPTEATSNEDAPGLDVRADAPTPVGAEPTEECIDDSDICGRCDRRHAAQECSEQSAAEWTAAHLSNPEPTDAP